MNQAESPVERLLKQTMEKRAQQKAYDEALMAAYSEDRCMLCHAYGEDKRTFMARCFYDMKEAVPELIYVANVPSLQVAFPGHDDQYFLRICKSCRGDLLGTLKQWGDRRRARRGLPMDEDGADLEPVLDYDASEGVPYIREFGKTRPMTAAEIAAMRAGGREPVRVMPEGLT